MKSIEMQNEKLFDTLQIVSHLESEYQLYRELCQNLIIQSKTNVTIEQIFDLEILITKQSNISKKIADIENAIRPIIRKYSCDTAHEFIDKNGYYKELFSFGLYRLSRILDTAGVLNEYNINEHTGTVQNAGVN